MPIPKSLRPALAGLVLLGAALPTGAQAAWPTLSSGDPAPVPRASDYRELAELPDFSGIWYPDWSRLFSDRSAARPQLTPAAQARFDAYQASIAEGGPDQYMQAHCIPPGIPGVMQQPYPIEILYSPGRVTLITEAYMQVRRIYTDGRALPEDPDFFFNGNSVGHWDGDSLVVETVGFHPLTVIAAGIEHSEQMKTVERIWREGDFLYDRMTITDPEVLTAPFVINMAFKLDNEFPLREYVCAENNRLRSEEGGANIDLGLDEGSGFDSIE